MFRLWHIHGVCISEAHEEECQRPSQSPIWTYLFDLQHPKFWPDHLLLWSTVVVRLIVSTHDCVVWGDLIGSLGTVPYPNPSTIPEPALLNQIPPYPTRLIWGILRVVGTLTWCLSCQAFFFWHQTGTETVKSFSTAVHNHLTSK